MGSDDLKVKVFEKGELKKGLPVKEVKKGLGKDEYALVDKSDGVVRCAWCNLPVDRMEEMPVEEHVRYHADRDKEISILKVKKE